MLSVYKNELRMYFFVMYNLSGIQKGIQAGHAALEYATKFKDDPDYIDFVQNHKTFIVLDGGGSNEMVERLIELGDLRIPYAYFKEPDLNNSMSAIAFILKDHEFACTSEECDEDQWWYNADAKRRYDYIRRFRLASN